MKAFLPARLSISLALAIVMSCGVSPTQAQPATVPPAASALPANIIPGSPLAEVIKMIQAGVDVATIESYIVNCQSLFNLDADKILFLTDMGAPSAVINAMMDRDKALYAATVVTIPPPPPPLPPSAPDSSGPDTTVAAGDPDAPDATPDAVDMNYFSNTLSPYGSWLTIDGYGRCWQPTAVVYDASWRPYCNRGHWVYTDYGWYWNSDYTWGAAFHYGRWFHHARYGWCWYPDTVWAPSWVTWRSDADYFGWAPLPPFAVFTPGVGFAFQGVNVGFDFNFGLGAAAFVFVSSAQFCDRHVSSVVVAPKFAPQIYSQTTVVNNFNVSGKTMVNSGIVVDRVANATHHSLEPVHVSSLPNAGRQGWRGEGFQSTTTTHHTSVNSGNNGNHVTIVHFDTLGQGGQGTQQGGNYPSPAGGNGGAPSQTYAYQQQQVRPIYPAPLNGWQRNSGSGTPVSGGSSQHGAEQLQQRQYPVVEQPRNLQPLQPVATQNQTPPRNQGNQGNGSNGGSNSGSPSGGSNSGSNRQGH